MHSRYCIYSCISQPFMTKKSPLTYTQRPDLSNPRNQHKIYLKSIGKTKFIKPVLIVFEFRHFLPHSSSTKMFEIINFKWLNKKLLELIFIVSSDCRADIFASSFAAVNSAELLFLLNDFSGLVTWLAWSCMLCVILQSSSVLLRSN